MYTSALLAAFAFIAPAFAAVSPTSPSGDTVVRVGQNIQGMWAADTTGSWNDVTVQLMTGDNFQMVPLQVLAQNVDGTKQTSANWPCPNVTPYSKIYFLQFTRGGDVSTATWTTRFTIAGADGSSTAPTNTTAGVQWGTGQLVGSDGQPIPNSVAGNVNVPQGNAVVSNSTSSTGGASSVAPGPATISVPASSAAVSPSPSAASASASTSASASGSGSATRSATNSAVNAAAASSSRAAAGRLQVGGWVAGLAGLVGVAFL